MSIYVTVECKIGSIDMSMENHNIIVTTLQEIQVEGLAMEDHQRDDMKYILVRFEKSSMLELHIIFIWLKDSE